MSKEKGEELFRALNVILDDGSSLNLRDLEAEAKADRGESSSKAAAESSKGKDKVAEPDWEDIPFNPVPITPLSSRPRFTQVVGSSSESMAPPRAGATVIRPPGDGGGDGRGRVLVVPLAVPLAVPLVVLLAVPDRAPVLAGAPAPAAATMAVVMAVVLDVALEAVPAALNSHPWRTTRRLSFWECGTTASPTWLVRTLNNKPSPAPQWQRSKLRRWSRSTCVCRRRSER
jgi:hypothetical protein